MGAHSLELEVQELPVDEEAVGNAKEKPAWATLNPKR